MVLRRAMEKDQALPRGRVAVLGVSSGLTVVGCPLTFCNSAALKAMFDAKFPFIR